MSAKRRRELTTDELRQAEDLMTGALRKGDESRLAEAVVRLADIGYYARINHEMQIVQIYDGVPDEIAVLDDSEGETNAIAEEVNRLALEKRERMMLDIEISTREMMDALYGDMPLPEKIPPRELLEEAKRRMAEYEAAKRGIPPAPPRMRWNNGNDHDPWGVPRDWQSPKKKENPQLEADSEYELPDEEDTLRAIGLELNEQLTGEEE